MTGLVSKTAGTVAATDLRVRFHEVGGKTTARIDVSPAAKPVFATTAIQPNRDVFYVRLSASTEELTGQALLDYQKKRWPSA